MTRRIPEPQLRHAAALLDQGISQIEVARLTGISQSRVSILARRGLPEHHQRVGVPVYDEDGALIAPSLVAAAQTLGCSPTGLRPELGRHTINYRDGVRLVSRPDPGRVGRRGGSLRRSP